MAVGRTIGHYGTYLEVMQAIDGEHAAYRIHRSEQTQSSGLRQHHAAIVAYNGSRITRHRRISEEAEEVRIDEVKSRVLCLPLDRQQVLPASEPGVGLDFVEAGVEQWRQQVVEGCKTRP